MTRPLPLAERILRQLEDNLTAAHREHRTCQHRWALIHGAALMLHGLEVS